MARLTIPVKALHDPVLYSEFNSIVNSVNVVYDAFSPAIKNANQAFLTGTNQVPITPVISTGSNAVVNYGASTIYGWGFPVGVVQNFNQVDISILSATTFTSWRLVIKEVNKDGAVLFDNTYTGTFGAANLKSTLTATNIPIIANEDAKRIWIEVYASAYINVYRTGDTALIFTAAAGYPPVRFTTVNNLGATTFSNTSGNMDIYAKFSGTVLGFEASDRLKDIIGDVAANEPLPENVDTAQKITNTLFGIQRVKIADKQTFNDSIGPLAGIYGVGFPIGVVKYFDSASFYAYHNTGTTTKLYCIIRKNNKDGDIVAQKELFISLTATQTLVTFTFDSIILNDAADKLYMTVFSDGPFGYYKRFPAAASIFTADNGYPPVYTTTNSSAYISQTLVANAGYADVWTLFSQYADLPYLTDTGQAVIGSQGSATVAKQLPATNKRISFAGSSVTWGDGFLQSGFVAETIKRMQAGLAKSIMPADVTVAGSTSKVFTNDRKLFLGVGVKIQGTGAEISFASTGNEVSITQLIERSNTSASVFEVFADDVKIGEFNNYNPTQIGSESKTFTGNGTDTKFDLGRAFTFGHTVTVAGAAKVVEMNTQPVGYTFAAGTDVAVIRKYSADTNGKPEVHHWLWFKVAPANGASIAVTQNYGEEICYEKTTIGKTATGVIESSYGDGNLAFDTTAPASITSGLDFRQTDTRSVTHFRFSEEKKRTIRIRIKGNYGTASGTPYLYFNFATNRYFHFQNAGIGGYEIFSLARDIGVTYNLSWQRITQFKPDYLILDVAPNEDWTVKGHKLYTSFTGTVLADLRKTVTFPLRDMTYNSGANNYSWSRFVGKISAIDETSVTIVRDSTHVVGTAPVQGDVVLMGTYFSDNREYVDRIVDTYDAGTGKITFLNPIGKTEYIYDDLSSLVGLEIRVRSLTTFTDGLTTLMNKIKGVAPELSVAIMTNPLPNINARELWGYKLVLERFAKTLGYTSLSGKSVQQFQNSQLRDQSFVIDASTLVTDPVTGYKTATLATTAGRNTLSPVILVNGVDVHGKSAFLENGWSCRPDPTLSGTDLNSTVGLIVSNKQVINATPPRLVFINNAPTSGNITVTFSSTLWSADSCHVNNNTQVLYGDVYANDFLKTL